VPSKELKVNIDRLKVELGSRFQELLQLLGSDPGLQLLEEDFSIRAIYTRLLQSSLHVTPEQIRSWVHQVKKGVSKREESSIKYLSDIQELINSNTLNEKDLTVILEYRKRLLRHQSLAQSEVHFIEECTKRQKKIISTRKLSQDAQITEERTTGCGVVEPSRKLKQQFDPKFNTGELLGSPPDSLGTGWDGLPDAQKQKQPVITKPYVRSDTDVPSPKKASYKPPSSQNPKKSGLPKLGGKHKVDL